MLFYKTLSFKRLATAIAILVAMTVSISTQAQRRMESETQVRGGSQAATSAEKTTNDTTNRAAIKKSGGSTGGIEDEIVYKSSDSIVLTANGTAFLHGSTEITYQTIKLEADFVRVKIDSSLVFAKGTKGEDGTMTGEPVFSEGESSYNSRELSYNLKSR